MGTVVYWQSMANTTVSSVSKPTTKNRRPSLARPDIDTAKFFESVFDESLSRPQIDSDKFFKSYLTYLDAVTYDDDVELGTKKQASLTATTRIRNGSVVG